MSNRTKAMAPLRGNTDVPRTFLLVPAAGVSLLSFAAALDPLRGANRVLKRDAYSWKIATPDGNPVTASNGLVIPADAKLRDCGAASVTMIFAGTEIDPPGAAAIIADIRRRARQGGTIAGISAGPWILGRAGLLDGYRCTVHWEYRVAFAREMPDAHVTEAPFEIDGTRLTSGGGTATMDLMFALIEEDHGLSVAQAVANQFQHERIRSNADRQRPSVEPDLFGRPDSVRTLVQLMAANIEEPLTIKELARHVNLTVRQVERLFRRHVNKTPTEYYIALRISTARELVLQTHESILDIAMSTGFGSHSHFAQSYRSAYGCTPSDERKRH